MEQIDKVDKNVSMIKSTVSSIDPSAHVSTCLVCTPLSKQVACCPSEHCIYDVKSKAKEAWNDSLGYRWHWHVLTSMRFSVFSEAVGGRCMVRLGGCAAARLPCSGCAGSCTRYGQQPSVQ